MIRQALSEPSAGSLLLLALPAVSRNINIRTHGQHLLKTRTQTQHDRRGPDHPWASVVEAALRVEQVRDGACPRPHGGERQVEVRRGVPQGGYDAQFP